MRFKMKQDSQIYLEEVGWEASIADAFPALRAVAAEAETPVAFNMAGYLFNEACKLVVLLKASWAVWPKSN